MLTTKQLIYFELFNHFEWLLDFHIREFSLENYRYLVRDHVYKQLESDRLAFEEIEDLSEEELQRINSDVQTWIDNTTMGRIKGWFNRVIKNKCIDITNMKPSPFSDSL